MSNEPVNQNEGELQSEDVNSTEPRTATVQQSTRQTQCGVFVQSTTSIRAWKAGKPDPVVYKKKTQWSVPCKAANGGKPTPNETARPIAIELPDNAPKKPIDITDKTNEPKANSSVSPPLTPAPPPLNRAYSIDTNSSKSRCHLTRSSRITHRGTKLTITHTEPKNRLHLEETSSYSSSSTEPADKYVRSSRLGRPSLGWNDRVSVNTPQRRESEHEVAWVEPDEKKSSSSGDDSDGDGNSLDKIRPSIIVNMDAAKGNRISISLAKLEQDIKQYLEKEDEELYST